MVDYSFNTNTPSGNPVFKTIRTDQPTTGPDTGWFFSPEIQDAADRSLLAQRNHITPNEVIAGNSDCVEETF